VVASASELTASVRASPQRVEISPGGKTEAVRRLGARPKAAFQRRT